MLNEVERMNKFAWLKERGDLIDLNGWINSLRFHRVEVASIEERNRISALAQYARSIAQQTINTASNQEDIDRGTREMNAASALGRGDIGAAFRSLDYFRDR
jgi:acylphosphatase